MRPNRILVLTVATLLALPLMAAAHPDDRSHMHHRDDNPGYGMGGQGMGSQGMMGPGMGMGGFGMMGPRMMGPGMMALRDDLPEDKQKQLDALQVSMMGAMRAKHREMRDARNMMHEAMQSFPVDKPAAEQALAQLTRIHKDMFTFHLGMMQQMQEIVGKERWEKMQGRFDEMHDRHMGGRGHQDSR